MKRRKSITVRAQQYFSLVLAGCLLLAGGCSSAAPNPDDSQNKKTSAALEESSGSKTQDKENTDGKNQNGANPDSEKTDSEMPDASDSRPDDGDSNSKNASAADQSKTDTQTVDEEQSADHIASTLKNQLEQDGYTCSDTELETSQTGNSVASFSARIQDEDSIFYVTTAKDAEMAQKTFDANSENDQAQGMEIMNEWKKDDTIVRVIRNNMANGNFIEVFDPDASATIHIENQLPEQLDIVLKALGQCGYPVS